MQVVVSLDATLDKSRRKIEFGNKPFLWTKVLRCLGPGMCNLSSHESFGCKTCGTIFKIWIRKTITHTSAFLLPTILITDPIYYANTTHPLPLTQTDNPFTDSKNWTNSPSHLTHCRGKSTFSPTELHVSQFFSLRKRCPKLYKDRCKKLKRVVLLFDLRANQTQKLHQARFYPSFYSHYHHTVMRISKSIEAIV